jgi:capsular polysaccharide biosynthesis protein
MGVGLSLLLEMRDTSVRSDKDLEALIQLPVLAVLPSLEDLTKAKLSIPAKGLANS